MLPNAFTLLAPGLATLDAPLLAPLLILGDWEPPALVAEADREIALELERRAILWEALTSHREALDLAGGDGWNPYPHEGAEEAVSPRTHEAGIERAESEIAGWLRRSGRLPVVFGAQEAPNRMLLEDLADRAEEVLVVIQDSGRADDLPDVPEGLTSARSFALNRARVFSDRVIIEIAAFQSEHFEITLRPGIAPVLSSDREGDPWSEDAGPSLGRRWVTDAPSVNPGVDRYEELVAAAMSGETERVRDLIAAGADPDLPEGHPPTPLAEAVRWPEPATVRALLELGADPFRRSDGRTPLGIAREQFAALSWVWSPAGDFAREMAREWEISPEEGGGVDLYRPECALAFREIIHLLEASMGLEATPFV